MATEITVPVRGMHCAACVGKVEHALAAVAGVESANVNLATERATIAFDPAQTDFEIRDYWRGPIRRAAHRPLLHCGNWFRIGKLV